MFGLWISLPGGAVSEDAKVAVIAGPNAPAFEEAFGAFKAALGDDKGGASPIQLTIVRIDENGPAKSSIAGTRPRVVVAFGSRAFEAVAASDPALPLIVTMVLSADAGGNAKLQRLVSTVSLSASPASILTKLKAIFPGRRRLAVLLSPHSSLVRQELLALANRLGYTLEIVECSGPRDVLDAFAALRGKVDFVWCLPDSVLFPSVAVAPIVLASIRNQLPLIGFSEGFVRAGATIGFYPDYADIGLQTAEIVKRYLSDQGTPRLEAPRKIRTAVNDRVVRILGIERPNLTSDALVVR